MDLLLLAELVMTTVEKKLLENVLDALDRLFVRHTSVIDLDALLFATTEALRDSQHQRMLERPLPELRAAIRSMAEEETQRELALDATNKLRHYLADLPID